MADVFDPLIYAESLDGSLTELVRHCRQMVESYEALREAPPMGSEEYRMCLAAFTRLRIAVAAFNGDQVS